MHGMIDVHSKTPDAVKLMNSSLSLVHAGVATLASLAGEMAGICDTCMAISGEE